MISIFSFKLFGEILLIYILVFYNFEKYQDFEIMILISKFEVLWILSFLIVENGQKTQTYKLETRRFL